jgi:hypothetical protein
VAALRQRLGELESAHAELAGSCTRLSEREGRVLQRLAWSKGSNRAAQATWQACSDQASRRDSWIVRGNDAFRVVMGLSVALTHFETYRVRNTETTRFDGAIRAMVQQLQATTFAARGLEEHAGQLASELPSGVVRFAPGGCVTAQWIEERRATIPVQAAQAEETLRRLVDSLPAQRLAIGGQIQEGVNLVSESTALLSELDPLLEPVVRAGDATAQLVLDGHREWALRFQGCVDRKSTETQAISFNNISFVFFLSGVVVHLCARMRLFYLLAKIVIIVPMLTFFLEPSFFFCCFSLLQVSQGGIGTVNRGRAGQC